ncbi:hypothetical protein ACRQ4C_17385 [Curtobacterium sp. SP.BCp]|uniref:hypothetical protein n=1 Tax=Curtobacterium sp. SP.BCp TaxID=3435230 RepID=UPI003F741384
MVVMWIVIGVVVVVAAALVVLELQNARRRRVLRGLPEEHTGTPGAGADGDRSVIEGTARSAHPGVGGAGGAFPG